MKQIVSLFFWPGKGSIPEETLLAFEAAAGTSDTSHSASLDS